MSENKDYFPVHNAFFRWSLLAILVIIIVMSNSFFYYQSRDVLAKGTLIQLEQSFKGQYESCLSQLGDLKICQAMLFKGIQSTWRSGRITVVDAQGTEVFEKNEEYYKDKRSIVVHSAQIGEGAAVLTLVMSKLSSPPLYISTWRSLTLSITEWGSQRDLSKFLITTVLPKSSSLIYSLITIGLLILMIDASDRRKRRIYDNLEAQNFIVNSDLTSVRDSQQLLLVEKNRVMEELKAQSEGGYKLLEDLYENQSKLEALEKEFAKSLEKEASLEADLLKNENALVKIQLNDNKKTDQSLFDSFLKKPDIELRKECFSYNKGKHHSKDFVEMISLGIQNDDVSSRIITYINAAHYGSSSRGKAILEWKDKVGYVLNVYDRADQGYCAEIQLSNKLEEAVLQAKYLVSGKNYLARKKYELKFGKLTVSG